MLIQQSTERADKPSRASMNETDFGFIGVRFLVAPPAGLGRSFGPHATLASLTLGRLLGLSGLLHRGLCSRGRRSLLGGAVRRRGLDLGRRGCSHHLLLDDLLLDHLGCCRSSGNHLHLSRSRRGGLGQGHRLGLSLDLNQKITIILYILWPRFIITV